MRGFPLFLLLFTPSCMSTPDPAYPTPFEDAVETVCDRTPDQDVCVAFRDLGTGRTLLRNADVALHAASTMKLAVMLEAYRQHEAKKIDLDRPMRVHNAFKSILDGSPYTLSADDDSEHGLYAHVGATLPAKDLVRRMMVRSSNLATNLLVEALDARSVQETLVSIGCRNMKVLRGVEDTPAFEAGLNNVTTARDLMLLLAALHAGTGISDASRDAMLEILHAQEFNDMIPAGVEPGTPVAHKTGRITHIRHDAGIVYPKNRFPYVLVVLTHGFDDKDAAGAVIREISRTVWTHATEEPR